MVRPSLRSPIKRSQPFRIIVNVPNHLAKVSDDAALRRLAGAESYARGLDYFSHGHVESLEEWEGRIQAVVRGGQDDSVRLAVDDGVADYACDCPVAAKVPFANTASRPRSPG